jgi:PhnB protein
MRLNPYLKFNGNAEEALAFYRDAIGGELQLMRFAGTPAEDSVPPEWTNKVLHGALVSPAGIIMATDSTTDRASNAGDNFSIAIQTKSETDALAAFSKLAQGGSVTIPFQNMFWNAKFGMLVDKFGIGWMVNCENA